jgi:hypothetical protein
VREKLLWVQINWVFGERPPEFQRCASFVANLFTFKLPSVVCKGTSKVNIDFTTYANMEGISKFDSILSMAELFPTEGFEEMNLVEKIELIARETYKALVQVYHYLNLDVAQLNIGYQKIIADNYQLVRTLVGSPKLNKSRTVTAIVIAKYSLDGTDIQINFCGKDNKVKEVQLFKTLPGWFDHGRLLHTGKWIENDTFELSNKTKEINFRVDISGLINMRYQPIGRDADGIKEEIRFFTLERYFEL